MSTAQEDSVGRSILAALGAQQHRWHSPPGPQPPHAAKPACPEPQQATSQALAHQGNGSCSQANLQNVLTHSPTPLLGVCCTDSQVLLWIHLVKAGPAHSQKAHELQLLGRYLIISQPLASLMNAGHSAFGLQHFLQLVLGK